MTAISNTGANTVRIVWLMSLSGGLDNNYLEMIIKRCIDTRMIPMIELHDVTGSSNVNDLLNCAKWFSNNMAMLKKYQKYILINIAGGWVCFF